MDKPGRISSLWHCLETISDITKRSKTITPRYNQNKYKITQIWHKQVVKVGTACKINEIREAYPVLEEKIHT